MRIVLQYGKRVIEILGEIALDVADMSLNEVCVVKQPLCGQRDTLFTLGGVLEIGRDRVDRAINLANTFPKRISVASGTGYVLPVRKILRVPFYLLGGQSFTAELRRSGPRSANWSADDERGGLCDTPLVATNPALLAPAETAVRRARGILRA